MKSFKMNFLTGLLLVLFVVVPVLSFGTQVDAVTPLKNPLEANGVNTIPDFIRILLQGVIKIGLPVVALAVIYTGFLFVKAQGNPEEITKAKEALLYTLIGSAVLLGAWAIANMIVETVKALS